MTAVTVETRRSPWEVATGAGAGLVALVTLILYVGLWLIELNVLNDSAWGYTLNPWPWLVAHVLLIVLWLGAVFMAARAGDDLDTPESRALSRIVFVGAILLFVLPGLFATASAVVGENGEVNGVTANELIAQLTENACPDGVADSANWPEQSDTDFALAAGPSLLGGSPSEVLDAWYGSGGRGCTQLAKELQALTALRPADVGLEAGDEFVNQLHPRWLQDTQLWEQSVDQTAPVFANLLANEYREEVLFRDRDAWCITVTNDHQVVQVNAVFVNPVSGYEGLPSLPESVEEGAHVWYLPAYDIFCQEAPFDRVPVQEGEVELGREAEEERVATDEAVEETAPSDEEAPQPTDEPSGDTQQPGADQEEDTTAPDEGGGTNDTTGPGDDEDGTTGEPGDGGTCEGEPGCAGEEPGGGGGGGDDDGDCPGCPGDGDGGDDGDDDCRNCPPDTTQPPDDGCPCPPPTSPSTTVPSTTTTTKKVTTTTQPPSTTTTTKATTTTTRATTTTTKATTTTTKATTTTQPTTTSTNKGTSPCSPFDPDCTNGASAQGPSTSLVLMGFDTHIPTDSLGGLLASVSAGSILIALLFNSVLRRREDDAQDLSL